MKSKKETTVIYRVLPALISAVLFSLPQIAVAETDTFPPLKTDKGPGNFAEMWGEFDPRAEPLEVEVLKEWQESDVTFRIVRFRIGVFKGKKARLAAVYGFPTAVSESKTKLPGLVQIHGGGQYADYKACLANALRGYATVSIAWAGRISAPGYRVTPAEVKLFWDGRKDDPKYKVTTDWGAVDGYHAPSRNPGNVFPSARAAAWTLDSVESPRNSGWFLCAVAARRALTFLEHQSEVDANRLGVYGHSMGGKLTVMTSIDSRVKAAAPSCGGISDRYNNSELFNSTIGDHVSLKQIKCPIIFLSPSNDFHGRIGDLPDAVSEIQSSAWRVTCSAHHNHQDTPEFEVATLLWFDQYLKRSFKFPKTPTTTLKLKTRDGVPVFTVNPDRTTQPDSIDVYYTQHGIPGRDPHENTMHRFWHHASTRQQEGGGWTARIPLGIEAQRKPLWVFANVKYPLAKPVSGVGYYYRDYTARAVNISSVLTMVAPAELKAAAVKTARRPSLLIESFAGDWEKQWFTYRPNEWARSTHKLYDQTWQAPQGARMVLEVQSDQPNILVILLDDYATEVSLTGGSEWQQVVLEPRDFQNFAKERLKSWTGIRRLKLSPAQHLRSNNRQQRNKTRRVGKVWKGEPPTFRNLRWSLE